eukprot:6180991-Pleurochrysis_carterae.AAC.1
MVEAEHGRMCVGSDSEAHSTNPHFLLQALRWFLQQASTFEADVGAGAVGRRQQVGFRRPALVLHVRTMSDHRAKNLTISEQRDAVEVGLRCFLSAASSISVGDAIADGRSNHHL